jgi:RNA polymerase sigma-70 factor (ECF subfamily)
MAEQVPPAANAREADAQVAIAVRAFHAAGQADAARERYAEIVGRYQRRALRIAFHYLRDAADADEAVQDAFVKAYMHLGTFREDLPFEVWFTRILINGCLDRLKQRRRRARWLAPAPVDHEGVERNPADYLPSRGPSPEDRVLAKERRGELMEAIATLPDRQRMVFMLSHIDGQTSREVSAITGLNESTVRVHLFRAIRRLRGLLTTTRSSPTLGRRVDRATR